MVLAAGPWYATAAYSAILSAAGVLAVVVIGVLGFWLLRLPLRRLMVFSTDTRSLIADPSAALQKSQLQVTYQGRPMTAPYLVRFALTSRSRTDIRRDDFDGGGPLVFDLGTPVALVGATVPGSQDSAGDWFGIDGSRINVHPHLIRRGESISLSLLTNERPRVTSQNSLAGVTLREKRSEADARRRWAAAAIPVIAALLLATNLTTGFLSHYLTSSGRPNPIASPSQPVGGTSTAAPPVGSPGMMLVGPQPGQSSPLQSTVTVLTDPDSGGIHAVAYSPGSQYLATGDSNGHFYIRGVTTGAIVHDIYDPKSLGVYAVAFSKDGSQFATGDGNGNVYLWSRTFAKTPTATLHDQNSGGIRAIAFSPDGTFVAAADTNGSVYIWNLTAGHADSKGDTNSYGVAAAAFSPDNSYLAAGDSNGHLFTWTHARQPGDWHASDSVAIRALAFTTDGKYLAAGDINGTTYIWATATWTIVSTPAVQATCGINGVAFSPDSKYLATADCDGHLYLWADTLTSTPSSPIAQSASGDFQQTGGLTAVAFSPDGTRLAAASSNGSLYQWTAHF